MADRETLTRRQKECTYVRTIGGKGAPKEMIARFYTQTWTTSFLELHYCLIWMWIAYTKINSWKYQKIQDNLILMIWNINHSTTLQRERGERLNGIGESTKQKRQEARSVWFTEQNFRRLTLQARKLTSKQRDYLKWIQVSTRQRRRNTLTGHGWTVGHRIIHWRSGNIKWSSRSIIGIYPDAITDGRNIGPVMI